MLVEQVLSFMDWEVHVSIFLEPNWKDAEAINLFTDASQTEYIWARSVKL